MNFRFLQKTDPRMGLIGNEPLLPVANEPLLLAENDPLLPQYSKLNLGSLQKMILCYRNTVN